jgi:hypothetical protein
MKTLIIRLLSLSLLATVYAEPRALGADDEKSADLAIQTVEWLPQGRFTAAGPEEMPTGWQVENWVRPYISLQGDGTDAFLRFDAQYGKDNDKTILAEIPVGEAQAVSVSFLTRGRAIDTGAEAWQTAAVELDFRSNGKKLGQMRLHLPKDSQNWLVLERVDQIPKGTDTILVRIGFWRSQGVFDVKDLSINGLIFPTPEIPKED